jgi:hypothetical protein
MLAAVLTGIVVAAEYLLAREAHLWPWPLDHVYQANDRRQQEGVAGAAEIAVPVLQHLRLASIDQHKGPPGVADVQRLIILIQDQYSGIDHGY